MSAETKTKQSITLEVDAPLLKRIEAAIQHVPPGWTINRVFEVGATELIQNLEQRWNKGKPFVPV
ncbi:MAG TPA: hypothetical protein VEI07_24195 [Planctomycetaceae bacterium]|nr:hypothetical protein [Planctomycetaceae bacterium]